MIKKMFPVFVLVLVTVVLAGCGVPQKEVDALNAQLAQIQKENESTKAELSSTRALLLVEQDKTRKLQTDLDGKTTALAQSQSSNDTLKKQVTELEKKLKTISDTQVVQYYKFLYGSVTYNWMTSAPLGTYFYYREQPRPPIAQYPSMALDKYGESVIDTLVRDIKDASLKYNLRKTDVANLVANFTQNLPHSDTDVFTPYDAYPRYPVETILDQGGDSADNSILAAALLVRNDYAVVFFVFEEQKHIALGVDISGASGTYWELEGKRYYYLETMGRTPGGVKWGLGESPLPFTNVRPTIIPVR